MVTRTACLQDLWATDEGMIVVGEDAADGAIRHISEVERGLACGCVCMGCRRKLVAKKSRTGLRRHFFAHHADGSPACHPSGESLLHLLGKRAIERHGRIALPAVDLIDHHGKIRHACQERTITLTDIRLEEVDGEIVPDIVAIQPDGRMIYIEICNFHKCPPEKLEKLRHRDVDVLEIYVSSLRTARLADLDEAIISTAPRKLLQCRAADVLQEQIRRERQAEEEQEADRVAALVEVYRDSSNRSHVKAASMADEFIGYGFSEILDLDDTAPSAFVVFRRQWQAAILFRLLDAEQRHAVYVMDMLRRFSERKWVKSGLARVKSVESRKIAATAASDFRSPFEEILGYLTRLEAAGAVVQQSKHGFVAKQDWLIKVRDALQAEEDAERRLEEVQGLFADIAWMMSAVDGELPSAGSWLSSRAAERGRTYEDFMRDGESGVCELIEDLRKLSKQVGSPTTDAPEFLVRDLDLPLETFMWRVRSEFYDRVDRIESGR